MGLASILKRRKRPQVEAVSIGGRDIISTLPDEMLGKILSSLPTKVAASTSVLSKRWSNLLPLVDTLDFDDSIFMYPKETRSSVLFPDFLDKTLALLSKCPIRRLSVNGRYESLVLTVGSVPPCNAAYRSYSCARCPHRITRDFDFFFLSETLVKLTLSDGCVIEDVPMEMNVVYFPSLKLLSLGHVVITPDEYDYLVAMSPVLEELFIHNDHSHPPSWPASVVGVMKRLVLYCLAPNHREFLGVWFSAGDIVYLDFSSNISRFYFAKHLSSLVEARLDIRLWECTIPFDDNIASHVDQYCPDQYGFDHTFGDFTCLLESISKNVKTLHLSPHSLEAIYFCCDDDVRFDTLLTLSFESDKDLGWQVLPRLLTISPNLETLVIKGLVHRVTGRCGNFCPCFHPRHRIIAGVTCRCEICESMRVSCLLTVKVKVLEILDYGGTCREIEQMRNFLGKMKCLELVKIGVKQQAADNNDLRLKLMEFPRLSSKCKIQFV